MRYKYKGFWGCDSCCEIEVHRRSDGKHISVAPELPDNPGTSITNQFGPGSRNKLWMS